MNKNYSNQPFYAWLIADLVMNVAGSVQYIITIQNLKLEYMQNMIVFEQLTVEEEVDGTKIIE